MEMPVGAEEGNKKNRALSSEAFRWRNERWGNLSSPVEVKSHRAGGGWIRSIRRQGVFLELVAQDAFADPQQLSGARLHTGGLLEGVANQPPFQLFHSGGEAPRRPRRLGWVSKRQREVSGTDD